MTRTPAERHDLLVRAIERDAGCKVGSMPWAIARRRVQAILQARHRYGQDAIGYYVVSGTQGADDVLAPLLLARWAEAYDRVSGEVAVDIAPLFDSVEALERSGEVMRTLLDDPLYRRHLEARGRRQCVALGYPDTSKESGICASRFAVYRAQEELSAALSAANERYVIFHARGGSIAGGGGRVDSLVRAALAGTISGVLRLTEQGEAINQGYGLRPIAMRTLERAFHALALGIGGAAAGMNVSAPQLEFATRVAAVSRQHYRRLVHGDADFYTWFNDVTPIDVITRMQIGSRPAVRPGKEGFDALRAVPWVFAWTQSRHLLPAWYGAGMGLKTAIDEHGLDVARSAYAEWNFFTTLVDDLEARWRAPTSTLRPPASPPRRLTTSRRAPARNSSWCASRCWKSSRWEPCWIARARCSAPSHCATPTSTRSTCCRWTCSGAGGKPAAWITRCSKPCWHAPQALQRDCRVPDDAGQWIHVSASRRNLASAASRSSIPST
jgi:phosphoenolpyruvate carboxylase